MTIDDFERCLMEKAAENAEQAWDRRSTTFFERTEKIHEEFSQGFVFQVIRDRQLLNAHSKVLDIGCGTGRHLFEFSRYTPYLTGTDISSGMLLYAQEKLKHIPHARLLHGNWMELFTKSGEYDFVFACMTPAIASIEHLKRMCFISKKYCMLDRFVYQKDDVQEEIEKLLGRPYVHAPHNRKEYVYGVWNILWQLGYYPDVLFDTTVQPIENEIDEYMEYFQGTETEKNTILHFLHSITKNGTITAATHTVKALILWEVQTMR